MQQLMLAEREIKLKLAQELQGIASPLPQAFDVARNICLVPPLKEKEIDRYFPHFEKVADKLKWPKES